VILKQYLDIYIGDVFKAVISLYVRDKTSPLPSLEEVLICNHNTTVEEVHMHAFYMHLYVQMLAVLTVETMCQINQQFL